MGDNPYLGMERITVDTMVDGSPATLVAYVAGDEEAFDEIGVDLVTKDGTMQLATAGVSRVPDDTAGHDVHCYSYIANGEDVSAAVTMRLATGHVEVDVDTPAMKDRSEADLSREEAGFAYWSDATPETLARADEDVAGFVATMVNALITCGAGRYDYLRAQKNAPRVRAVGGMTFVGQDGAYLNLTGDSLVSVAEAVLRLVDGDVDRSRCIASETLDLWAARPSRAER